MRLHLQLEPRYAAHLKHVWLLADVPGEVREKLNLPEPDKGIDLIAETHKTTGRKDKMFAHLLFDENLPVKRRMFMTATERRFIGSSNQIASMDDPEIYGDTFHLLTFKAALGCNPPILSDYQVVLRCFRWSLRTEGGGR